MRQLTPRDQFRALTLETMIKHFTVTEIEAMAGKSINKKMGGYLAEIMPWIWAEMLRALQKVKADMQI